MIGTPANFPTAVNLLEPGDLVIISHDTGEISTANHRLATVVHCAFSQVSSKWVLTLRADDREFTRHFSANWQNGGKPMELMRVRFISAAPVS